MSGISVESTASPTAKIVGDNTNAPSGSERRSEPRRPINIGFQIVPLDRCGRPLYHAAFTATGKDISNSGLAVSHIKPMEYARALIVAMGSSSEQFRFEAEVAWTGPASTGLYETGFKVTRKII
jgi:hypothetical protein